MSLFKYVKSHPVDMPDGRTGYTLEHTDYVVVNTHSPRACAAQPACPIHNLSDHNMRDFPQWFRGDNGLMERTCPHGIGHPDPDGLHYFRDRGMDYMEVHGCDGCCD